MPKHPITDMALQKNYSSEEEIPEAARGLYEQTADGYVLSSEFAIKDERVDEFRENNRQMKAELDQMRTEYGRLQKQFEGVDPDQFAKFQEQLARVQEDEERQLIASGQIDEVVKRRTARLLDEKNAMFEAKSAAYTDLETNYNQLRDKFATSQARTQMDGLMSERGLRLRPQARQLMESQVTRDWTTDESGRLTLRDTTMIGESGDLMTPIEYVDRMVTQMDFLFEPNVGGGATGAESGGQRGQKMIQSGDVDAISANLADIASGKLRVNTDNNF
jgi:hypothetical protein